MIDVRIDYDAEPTTNAGQQASPERETPLVDITSRTSSMPRDSALLYPNRKPKDAHSPFYLGLLKTANGSVYWAVIWIRLVKGERVLELRIKERHQ